MWPEALPATTTVFKCSHTIPYSSALAQKRDVASSLEQSPAIFSTSKHDTAVYALAMCSNLLITAVSSFVFSDNGLQW